MPDAILHLIVPFLILLAICDRDKYVYIHFLVFMAIVPDIDILYKHRLLLHNLFVPLMVFGLACVFVNKRYKNILFFTSIYLFSHTVLDVFNGGVAIFYPFYNNVFVITTEIMITESHELTSYFQFGFMKYILPYDHGNTISVISSLGVGIVTLSLCLLILKKTIYQKVKT